MTYNILKGNEIVKAAIKRRKFLISCEEDNIKGEEDE